MLLTVLFAIAGLNQPQLETGLPLLAAEQWINSAGIDTAEWETAGMSQEMLAAPIGLEPHTLKASDGQLVVLNIPGLALGVILLSKEEKPVWGKLYPYNTYMLRAWSFHHGNRSYFAMTSVKPAGTDVQAIYTTVWMVTGTEVAQIWFGPGEFTSSFDANLDLNIKVMAFEEQSPGVLLATAQVSESNANSDKSWFRIRERQPQHGERGQDLTPTVNPLFWATWCVQGLHQEDPVPTALAALLAEKQCGE